MDTEAVKVSKEKDLKELGLKAGDAIALKAFASSVGTEESTERKRKLLLDICQTSLNTAKKNRKSPSSALEASEKPKPTRNVQGGWMHYQSSKSKYTVVRLARGGGTRNISIQLHKTMSDILKIFRETFFPDGENIYGKLSNMVIDIGNFKGDRISDNSLTLADYIDQHKLSKVRLYIMTKTKQPVNDFDESASEQNSDDVVDDDEFQQSIFHYSLLPDLDDMFTESAENSSRVDFENTSTLVGSSAERCALKEEQDKEYTESLAKDQLKAKVKTRQQNLRDGRALRVPDIPRAGEPYIEVSVRHNTMGLVTRRFSPNHTVSVVYDWIGSMSLIPEHFTLSTHSAVEIGPSIPIRAIDKVMLYMTERDESLNYPEDEVTFLGYGGQSPILDNTLSPSTSTKNPDAFDQNLLFAPLTPSVTATNTASYDDNTLSTQPTSDQSNSALPSSITDDDNPPCNATTR